MFLGEWIDFNEVVSFETENEWLTRLTDRRRLSFPVCSRAQYTISVLLRTILMALERQVMFCVSLHILRFVNSFFSKQKKNYSLSAKLINFFKLKIERNKFYLVFLFTCSLICYLFIIITYLLIYLFIIIAYLLNYLFIILIYSFIYLYLFLYFLILLSFLNFKY